MSDPILQVEDLRTHFFTRAGVVRAVDGVSLSVRAGQVLGLVGESGSGKTVTGQSILRLVEPPGRIVGGRVLFSGEDLLASDERRMRAIRGNRIAMVFQDPMATLNPVLRIDVQMIEAILAHRDDVPAARPQADRPGARERTDSPGARDRTDSRSARDRADSRSARERALAMLGRVGIPAPEQRMRAYPHQLSGGMRQRVAIAIALLNRPDLIIADEPTTALDVTIQGQILAEVQRIAREDGTALVWITHDLSVVAGLADQLAVMYCGRIVEHGEAAAVLESPRHPYTRGLLASIPAGNRRGRPLAQIPGMAPSPAELPSGCAFRPRCARASEACLEEPRLVADAGGRSLRCFHPWPALKPAPGAVPQRR